MVDRLNMLMESRIHGDVYVRFGGERLETYRPKGRQGALRLACGITFFKYPRHRTCTFQRDNCRIFSILG